MLFTGTINVARWYRPMPFFFTVAHYWVAWITIGSLIIHVGAKITTIRRSLSPHSPDLVENTDANRDTNRNQQRDAAGAGARGGLGRRGFIATVFATAVGIVLTTSGQTLRPLARLGLLAPRLPDVGPQGFPVNRSAIEAGVTGAIADPAWQLVVEGKVATTLHLSIAQVQAMTQHSATLPIACVEGWSASASWTGVRVSDLLAAAGAAPGAEAMVHSVERDGLYRQPRLNRLQAADGDTLLALKLDGETLDADHGYPMRLIGPNRPGVMCTKWVTRLEVL